LGEVVVTTVQNTKVIVFRLGLEQFGADVHIVSSIERMQEITLIPETASFVRGVVNLRGSVIPVLDLRERLGFGQVELTIDARMLVVRVHDVDFGLLVDSAHDVLDVAASEMDERVTALEGIGKEYVRAVAKTNSGLLVLLRLDRIISADATLQIRREAGLAE